ncbi:MAG TPA: RidA family protein [Aurantimonas sp.]|uniref:RidA family protein n=1 Tax=Aurantimonas marianensis TaxID=2920428 RepID=A0A9X2KEN6_9HYPH|nr:RidA family protein [Aurantimonas marianensis]
MNLTRPVVGEAATSDRPTAGSGLTALQPAGWPTPKGYANGVMGRGNMVLTGGLIGWDENKEFPEGFVDQVERTLTNVLAVVAEAGGGPEHIARLTWYVRSIPTYRASLAELGPVYRRVMGRHYPAMALVEVSDLVEPKALVEIEATAIVPD